jgi:hypothetical protein
MPCQKIPGIMNSFGMPEQLVLSVYPTCESFLNGTSPNQHAVVPASVAGGPEQAAAPLDMTFGMSIWMACLTLEVLVSLPIAWATQIHLSPNKKKELALSQ